MRNSDCFHLSSFVGFLVFLICLLNVSPLFSYSVWNGCPDFMDLNAPYVQALSGVMEVGNQNALMDKEGVVEGRHTLIEEKAGDVFTGNQLSTLPDGEKRVIRLGNEQVGGEVESIVYHFTVAPDNSLLFVNFAVVLEDPGHESFYQPRFVIRIMDKEGKLVSDCAEYDVSAAAGLDGFQDYQGNNFVVVRWRDWTKVGLDLSPYANQEVQVQFVTYDCALMGHFGYAYFTAHCAPNKLEVKECGGNLFTVSAPEGFASYRWDNGDTTRSTTRRFSNEDMNLYCEVTSVTGCTFVQNAFISANADFTESFFKDTICQGETYELHGFGLPPQHTVGTTIFNNLVLDPTTCSESAEVQLELTVLQQFYEIEASICEGEDYNENGFSIMQPPVGVLFDTLFFSKADLEGDRRCDSIVCLKLNVSETLHLDNKISGDVTPCTGVPTTYFIEGNAAAAKYSWTLSENVQVLSGGGSPQIVLSFTDDRPATIVIKGENGCGTNAVPLDVQPRLSYHQIIKDTACVGEVYSKNNFNLGKLMQAGYFTYTQSLKTSLGCDSVVVLGLHVFVSPSVKIETEGESAVLCSSDRVVLKAVGESDNMIFHDCDSLPVAVGDIYFSDGTFAHPKEYETKGEGKSAEGVVYYVSPDFEYALVAYKKNYDEYIRWSTVRIDVPGLTNHTQVRKVLLDDDGYANTAILRAEGSAQMYPAAWAVDFDEGWYVPAIGEMRILFSEINWINPVLSLIGGEELPSYTNEYSKVYDYISSTELAADYFCSQNLTGEVIGNPKGSYSYLRQIKKVTLQNLLPEQKPKVKIGDLVQNEYGEKGVAFDVQADGRTGYMVALKDIPISCMWSSKLVDIEELPNLYHIDDLFASQIYAESDWRGEENTRILRKNSFNENDWAVWAVALEKGWFVPSAGQLGSIYALLPTIDSSLVRNGGDEFAYDHYWSSSERTDWNGWAYDMAFGNLDAISKNTYLNVRAISRFSACEPYVEVLDSSLAFQWQSGENTPFIEVTPEETTTYTVTATSKEGCSVSASKTLFVTQNEKIEIWDTICAGEVFKNEFFEVSKEGVYTKIVESDMCSQEIVLHLEVAEKSEVTILEEQICQGGTYNKNGFNIKATASGLFRDTSLYLNSTGCDSVVVLYLKVAEMERDTIRKKICQNESYFENGFSVTANQKAGLHYFVQTVEGTDGCVSSLTLALQVDSVFQRSIVDSICGKEQYLKYGFEIEAEEAGIHTHYRTLQSKSGCDSTVALSLKVLPTDETIFTDTIVVGESYESADFILPAQTELGWHSFYKHLQNSSACDSLLTLNLLVVGDEDVVNVPTAFSPQNQNGVNDVFMKGYEVYIYDRYGLLVCHSNDGWDGTYRGKLADAGVYIYKLIFKSGKEKSGTVEIFKE